MDVNVNSLVRAIDTVMLFLALLVTWYMIYQLRCMIEYLSRDLTHILNDLQNQIQSLKHQKPKYKIDNQEEKKDEDDWSESAYETRKAVKEFSEEPQTTDIDLEMYKEPEKDENEENQD